MPHIPLDIPPGLNSDDTAFAASPAWVDMSMMRFRLRRAQVVGGFESVIADLLGGVCRSALPWTDTANSLNIGFGTHQSLEVYQGGELFDITPASGFTAGAIDGSGSTGYGTGAYGVGGYGEPSVTDYFPLTWSLATYGANLVANPRNQTIFRWQNNTATPAAAVANAPDNVTYAIVVRDQVFALGCNEEVSTTFNPMCIRHSGARDIDNWTTSSTTATASREYVLPGGGRIVAGRELARSILVWTNSQLFLGTYVGHVGQVWRFDKVGDKCGLIGPAAVVVKDATAYWISPDRQFHAYTLGGTVQSIPCPIREDFADNLAASQADKIVASTIVEFGEVRFDYPDARDGYENSRYIALCVEGEDAGAWSRGQQVRTAMIDAGPSLYPCGVDYDGHIYWHERGHSADGAALDWFIETADIYLSDDLTWLARSIWPDIANQVGPVTMHLYTRFYPQGEATTYGPYTIAPGDDWHDFKASGRLCRVRFEGGAAPTDARMGRVLFDVKMRGRK